MKEIRILIQQLRNYPNNFFVYPVYGQLVDENYPTQNPGLVVCDMDGNQQGFIETGGEEGVVIQ